jgi:hypothetical protein
VTGNEEEAAELLDAYLDAQRERADEAARSAGDEIELEDDLRDSRATVRDVP